MRRPRLQGILGALVLVGLLGGGRTEAATGGASPPHGVVVGLGQTVEDITTVGVPVHVAGTVDQTVIAFGGVVTLAPTAHVRGDMYILGGVLEQDPRAQVDGSITVVSPAVVQGFAGVHPWGVLGGLLVVRFVLLLAAGILAWQVAPTAAAARQMRRLAARPVRGMGLGLLWAALLGTAALVASLTVIGLPVGLVLLFVLGGEGVLGLALAMAWLREPGRVPAGARRLLVGVVVLLGLIPIMGEVLLLGFSVLGLGATLEMMAESRGARCALQAANH
jgi:hypothetical protein